MEDNVLVINRAFVVKLLEYNKNEFLRLIVNLFYTSTNYVFHKFN